jgi:hypothetical protein
VVLASISLLLSPLLLSLSLLLLFSLVCSIHEILGSLSLGHYLDPAVTRTNGLIKELIEPSLFLGLNVSKSGSD